MKRLIYRFLIVTLVWFVGIGANAEPNTSTFDCFFDRHYAVYLNENKSESYDKDPTSLSIIKNKTTKSTSNLDGGVRATNSTDWTLIVSEYLGASYIGNKGDLLTIQYKSDDGAGTYKASLQWTSLGYAFSSIGICSGKP